VPPASRPRDFVPTPPEALAALLQSPYPPPPGQPILDPCMGAGAILIELLNRGYPPDLLAGIEVRPDLHETAVRRLSPPISSSQLVRGDLFGLAEQIRPGLSVVTNPPYSLTPRFPLAVRGLPRQPYCALLLPVEELAGVHRALDWLQVDPPSALVCLPWRPFPHHVRGVAWLVWQREERPIRIHWPELP